MLSSSPYCDALVVCLCLVINTCWVAQAWHTCGETVDDGVCPKGNKCCIRMDRDQRQQHHLDPAAGGVFTTAATSPTFNNNNAATAYCISGKNDTMGDCFCSGDQTGCGPGYACSEDATGAYCWRLDPHDETIPFILPPYKLCTVEPQRRRSLSLSSSSNSESGRRTIVSWGHHHHHDGNHHTHDENDDADDVSDGRIPDVYGLPMLQSSTTPTAHTKTTPVVAYLSSGGALDADDEEEHAHIRTAWIVVHGSGRNPDDYLCCASAAVVEDNNSSGNSNSSSSTTLVLTPWFLAPEDGRVNITIANDTVDVSTVELLRWADRGPIAHTWRYGADAMRVSSSSDNTSGGGGGVSSYAVVDAMIERLLTDTARFPALERIVVAGHSAGGQLVQRWALLTNGLAFGRDSSKNGSGNSKTSSYMPRVPTRVVVANPKSMCWLDERRVFHGILRLPQGDAIDLCPTYNEWEWGLDRSGIHQNTTERDALYTPYFDQALVDAGGRDALIARYPSRDVVYLAGELDVLPNGDCEARMQGAYRRIRSANFFAALQQLYGRSVHHRLVVTGVHHDHCLMFQSPAGQRALFGELDELDNQNAESLLTTD